MGFYDCNCMVTGVSLKPVDATAVVLHRRGAEYRPIALGITGTYDRLGGIDGVEEDLNTDLIVRYFVEQHRVGRFFAENQVNDAEEFGADVDIEGLLQLIERTHLSFVDDFYPASTVLDGDAIAFALIAQPVWDTIANSASASNQSPQQQFQGVFGQSSTAAEIYADQLPELTLPLHQLTAINDFITAHGLRWAPPSEPDQRYPGDYGSQHFEEVKQFLNQAKHDYREDPVALTGLAAYEQLIDWDDHE
ncbi:hypothetical protein ACFVUS_27535 [Nocardia sp. NPDC058058]|uniref:hypothetical protein n=1 Tax=Nocardia sp. NPDC058058 TaxID=3346317 RepID=UPI0036DEA0DC